MPFDSSVFALLGRCYQSMELAWSAGLLQSRTDRLKLPNGHDVTKRMIIDVSIVSISNCF